MSFARVAPTLAPPGWPPLLRGMMTLALPAPPHDVLAPVIEGIHAGFAARGYGSGRAALCDAFRAAAARTGRSRVVLPAYTSYSVAAAAAAAGVQADLCDVDPDSLALDRADLARLVGPDTAAVLIGNLFGFPERVDDLGWLPGRGVLVIDDAAQAFGASDASGLVGGRGDLGVLSFGRGKCVTLGDGGVLLARDRTLLNEAGALAPAGRMAAARLAAMSAAVQLARHPGVFGLLSRLPGAGIGESHFDPAVPRTAWPSAARGLADDLATRASSMREQRTRVAAAWRSALALPGWTLPGPAAGSTPAWLRVPLVAPSVEQRARAADALASAGLPYVASYPTTLGAIPEFRRLCGAAQATPKADRLAACLLALPCHEGVGPDDIARAARALAAMAGGRS